MAKYYGKKRSSHGFVIGMIVYAVVFLLVAAIGLSVFWKFIEAYERSRPKTTMDQYVATLRADSVCEGSSDLIATVDAAIQGEEDCFQQIRDEIQEPVTYAKKSKESTSERQVYALYCGKQLIGETAITAGGEDKFGFAQWSVAETTFDMSYLLGEAISVTVPETFQVAANGFVLDDSYITEDGLHFAALEDFYDDYELITMVTYTVEDYLGEISLEIKDAEGNPVEITSDTDMDTFIPVCTEAEQDNVSALAEAFLTRYVAFTGAANRAPHASYAQLQQYMVPGCALAQRLRTALDGLQYAQSHGDKITNIAYHHVYQLGEGRYLCDATYTLETIGKKGMVETQNNVKLMILETDSGLKVEAMTRY